jgi:hypothetical protein
MEANEIKKSLIGLISSTIRAADASLDEDNRHCYTFRPRRTLLDKQRRQVAMDCNAFEERHDCGDSSEGMEKIRW